MSNVRTLTLNRLRHPVQQGANFRLLLTKFQPWKILEEGEAGQANADLVFDYTTTKGWWLGARRKDQPASPSSQLPLKDWDANLIKQSLERWRFQVPPANRRRVVALSRIVIGLGNKGTLEMGLTLHKTYGQPYLPGTALKGVARQAALEALTGAWLKGIGGTPTAEQILNALRLMDRALDDHSDATGTGLRRLQEQVAGARTDDLDHTDLIKHAQRVFGTPAGAGNVVFVDGVIESPPVIVQEIVNPHYPSYYRGVSPWPTDDQKPVPVVYLAVERGSTFWLGLLPRRPNDPQAQADVDRAWTWLMAGLTEVGVGGKTAAGLGVLAPDEP